MPARPSTPLPSSLLIRLAAALLVAAGLMPGRPLDAAGGPHGPSQPANGPPVAHDDNLAAFPGVFQNLYVLDNDTDPDGDTLTVSDVGYSLHGSTFNDFTDVAYEPIFISSGTDTFTYTVTDGHNHFSTATVHVTVAETGSASTRFAVYAGPNDSSIWTVNPHGGATSALPSGTCNNALGLGVEDVVAYNQGGFGRFDGFDNGLTLWVNGNQVTPVFPMAVTHHSLASGPVPMSGVNVTVHYDGILGSSTLRTRVAFANSSGSTKAITATVATNVGSDLSTVIPGSSDGNQTFSTADRWVVTSDSLTNPSLVVDTHVLYGPGTPLNTTTEAFNTTFVCNEDPVPNTHGIRARFNLSIPNGQTQELLFFNQAHQDNATALTDAAALFNSTPVCCLDGIGNPELAEIVNWKLGPISHTFLPMLARQ